MLLSRLTPCAQEIAVDHHQYGFRSTSQLLIIYSELVKYCRRKKMGIQ